MSQLVGIQSDALGPLGGLFAGYNNVQALKKQAQDYDLGQETLDRDRLANALTRSTQEQNINALNAKNILSAGQDRMLADPYALQQYRLAKLAERQKIVDDAKLTRDTLASTITQKNADNLEKTSQSAAEQDRRRILNWYTQYKTTGVVPLEFTAFTQKKATDLGVHALDPKKFLEAIYAKSIQDAATAATDATASAKELQQDRQSKLSYRASMYGHGQDTERNEFTLVDKILKDRSSAKAQYEALFAKLQALPVSVINSLKKGEVVDNPAVNQLWSELQMAKKAHESVSNVTPEFIKSLKTPAAREALKSQMGIRGEKLPEPTGSNIPVQQKVDEQHRAGAAAELERRKKNGL